MSKKDNPLIAAPPLRRRFVLEPAPAGWAEIGTWSAALTDCRARTLKAIAGITQDELDWKPAPGSNTIGALLYHIALIEVDWLYTEILELPIHQEFKAQFPLNDRASSCTQEWFATAVLSFYGTC